MAGGSHVDDLITRAAEAMFTKPLLAADEELHLRTAFLAMVRVDEEGRYVRRPALWKELPEVVHDLLERFVQARLLVSRSDNAERIVEVAHEALFRSWERLVAWLNADREFLLWCQRLRVDIAEWERNTHDESMLLRGPVLAEAERWLGERADGLNPAEREFITVLVATRLVNTPNLRGGAQGPTRGDWLAYVIRRADRADSKNKAWHSAVTGGSVIVLGVMSISARKDSFTEGACEEFKVRIRPTGDLT